MSIFQAIGTGLARAATNVQLVILLWLVNLLFVAPMAWMMADSIHRGLGEGAAHESMLAGLDLEWLGEYSATAEGLGETLRPSIVGATAVFDNLESLFTGELFTVWPSGLVIVGILYMVLWTFLLGGVLDRLARPGGGFELSRFTSLGGGFFYRFLRLTLLGGGFYYLIYRLSHWLFGRIEAMTIDVTSETTVLAWVLAGAALIAWLLALVNLVFDYAKVALFLEDHRSVVAALLTGLRFVASNSLRTTMTYFGVALVGVVVIGLYALVAPGPAQASWVAILLAFLVGQLYLVLRLVVRLAFFGSEIALFESVAGRGRVMPNVLAGGYGG